MSHDEATAMKAPEMYVGDELTANDRERFELHYFECDTCADAVIAAQTLVRAISEGAC